MTSTHNAPRHTDHAEDDPAWTSPKSEMDVDSDSNEGPRVAVGELALIEYGKYAREVIKQLTELQFQTDDSFSKPGWLLAFNKALRHHDLRDPTGPQSGTALPTREVLDRLLHHMTSKHSYLHKIGEDLLKTRGLSVAQVVERLIPKLAAFIFDNYYFRPEEESRAKLASEMWEEYAEFLEMCKLIQGRGVAARRVDVMNTIVFKLGRTLPTKIKTRLSRPVDDECVTYFFDWLFAERPEYPASIPKPATEISAVEVANSKLSLALASMLAWAEQLGTGPPDLLALRAVSIAHPPPAGSRGPLTCWHCNEPGHRQFECALYLAEKEKEDKILGPKGPATRK